jgi:hypothetical protein
MKELGQVNIQRTIEVFGYDPNTLKPSSCKLVIVNCVICGNERQKGFRYAVSQPSCQKCANTQRAKDSASARSANMKQYYAEGGRHAMQGHIHTSDAKEKIAAGHRGKPLSEAHKEKVRTTWLAKNWKPTEEMIAAARLRRGPLSASYGKLPSPHTKKVWYTRMDGTRVCFRSSWEAKFAKWLDSNFKLWDYEPKTFPVVAVIDNENFEWTYTPDFLVEGHWYEVKGRWTVEGKAKHTAFVAQFGQDSITVCDREWFRLHGIQI